MNSTLSSRRIPIALVTLAVAATVVTCGKDTPTSPGGGFLPPSGPWPNEPAGFSVVTDWGMDEPLPAPDDVPIVGSPDWNIIADSAQAALGQAIVQLSTDPGAPFSPPNVYDFIYPKGMVEGNAPATVYRLLTADAVYAGMWWKPSSPFDMGPNGNKIAFLFNGGGASGGQQFIILTPGGVLSVLPEYPGDYRWRTPNVTATPVRLGAWHKLEWFADRQSGALRWWLDGILQGSYNDAPNPVPFNMFQLSPTWGGNSGAVKRETDHYWFDHVHVSAR
jgi:hypothetical protein